MKNYRISWISRIIIVLCGLALIAVLFTPIWRIDLVAPQYPEGLMLLIHADKLAGNVDIINGLNHYIGMKKLDVNDFPEFKILPGIIIFFSAAFILVGLLGRRRWMHVLLGLFVAFGILAMVDFWRWEYDYGHNLDPNAAIIVPGMAYQPPLIGFKQLLNFGAWSFPDVGGWIFVSAGALLLFCVILEWRNFKKWKLSSPRSSLLILFSLFAFSSCSTEPEPIRFGKDNCHFCKMTISDNRFGAEIVTGKSKVYKFDDSHCLFAFLKTSEVPQENINSIYLSNYAMPNQLLDADKALLFKSDKLKSPMGGTLAAFDNADSLNKFKPYFEGKEVKWTEVNK